MSEITNKEKIGLVNQTLSYIIDSNVDEETIYSNLDELEGDYYTFFNPSFSLKLKNECLISSLTKTGLDFLFEIINSITSDYWNPISFKEELLWKQARSVAKIIQSHLE